MAYNPQPTQPRENQNVHNVPPFSYEMAPHTLAAAQRDRRIYRWMEGIAAFLTLIQLGGVTRNPISIIALVFFAYGVYWCHKRAAGASAAITYCQSLLNHPTTQGGAQKAVGFGDVR